MTTCAECLSEMSTTRLSELSAGSPVTQHCATCASCAHVAEEIRYAEHRLASALNEQRPITDSSQVAIAALDGSERLRRKRVARWIQGALLVAACAVFATFMERTTNRESDLGQGAVTRTVTLKCITGEQATALATPYLRSKAAIYPVPGMAAITIRGKERELQRAISEIDEFDLQCQLPKATTPKPTPTSPSR